MGKGIEIWDLNPSSMGFQKDKEGERILQSSHLGMFLVTIIPSPIY